MRIEKFIVLLMCAFLVGIGIFMANVGTMPDFWLGVAVSAVLLGVVNGITR